MYTVAELDRWAIQSNWGEPRKNWLRLYMELFAILVYDRALCTKWAEVMVAARARGYRIECADAWIAATHYFARLISLSPIFHFQPYYGSVRIKPHSTPNKKACQE